MTRFVRAGFPWLVFTALAAASCTSSSHGSCDDFFNVVDAYYQKCGSGAIEVDRARWNQYCGDLLSAPGSGVNLSACGNEVSAATPSCDSSIVEGDACNFKGSLAAGAACGVDSQCQSGFCAGAGVSSTSGSGGTFVETVSCGTCAAIVAVGQPCDASKSRCADGAHCITSGTGFQGTCVADLDAGASCDGATAGYCKQGLRCSSTSNTCTKPSDAGGPCNSSIDCSGQLVCNAGSCTQGASEGAACAEGTCASPLVCGPSATCVKPKIANPGEPCDEQVTRCAKGTCPIAFGTGGDAGTTTATCPQIIPDGQPCTPGDKTKTCDDYAYCTNGTCQFFNPASCK